MAHDTADVAKLLAYARRTRTPLTFRAAGTSLNGQGQSDGILVDVRRHWRGSRSRTAARGASGQRPGARQPRWPHGYRLGPTPPPSTSPASAA